MSKLETSYAALTHELHELHLLASTMSLLGWDQQTYRPIAAAKHRSDQIAFFSKMHHERFTSPKVLALIDELAAEAPKDDSDVAVNVRELKRSSDRSRKLPTDLVEELSRTESMAQDAWIEAKKTSDFAAFSPWLEKLMTLKKRVADCYGYADSRYDALLDEYEPAASSKEIAKVFDALREPLMKMVRTVIDSGKKPPTDKLTGGWTRVAQEAFARRAATAVGFSFDAGRLDVSTHPFCTDLGAGDVRITTRFDDGFFVGSFYGVLHEVGHALYEQGLPVEHYPGLPRSQAISLGIHESQSRMWENLVGRSQAFWTHFFPIAREVFGDRLNGISEQELLFAVNDVHPSLIRTEADEVTYNLHVLLRFEIEKGLVEDQIKVSDLPDIWQANMKKYLGIDVPSHAKGCMQDIHWSAGLLGYFPTYTLGNLYASQFFEAANKDLGDLNLQFAKGEFRPLLDWLRKNIHQHGKTFTASQLVQRVTGKPLSPEPLLKHLNAKVSQFYA
jgi:carboxypeptidase Taq